MAQMVKNSPANARGLGSIPGLGRYLLFIYFLFPSHLRHHRVLSSVPCAIQWAFINY